MTVASQKNPSPIEGTSPITLRASWLLAALTVMAALAGLLLDGVYTGPVATAAMLRGYDIVSLAVGPALALAAWQGRRGSTLGHLLATSLIAYIVYTYAFYLFGTGFNDLFLLHVAIFGTGVVALVLAFVEMDVGSVAALLNVHRVRIVAGILGILAAALGGMWIYAAVDNAINGTVPTGSQLVETDTIVRLGMALDLALLVPLYAIAAVLLWRRAAWGYPLAAVALVAGLLHQVSYLLAMPLQVAADVPGAVSFDFFEPIIVLAYAVGVAVLFQGCSGQKR